MELSSNIWKLYLYKAVASMEFSMPIFFIFLLDNKLSLTQIALLQAWFSAAVMILNLPAGAFADKYGRKNSIILSSVIVFIACVTYASSYSFAGFFAAETLWAVGISFMSGPDTALLYDTLKNLKREHEFKRRYGTFNAVYLVFLGIAAIAGGFLAKHSLRFPFWMALIPYGIAIIIPFTFMEPKLFKPVELKYWTHIKEAVKYTARHPRLRFLIIYSAVIVTISEITYWFYQPYYQQIGIPIASFGILSAVIMAATAFGSKIAHNIESRFGEKITLLATPLIFAASLILMGTFAKVYSIAFIMAYVFAAGLIMPVVIDYMQRHIESYRRATIMSFQNMSQSLSIAVIGPFVGVIADAWSIQAAFMISGIALAIYFVILAAVFLVFNRR